MRQTGGLSFGTEFEVKYWHAKDENRKCCPQHGALNGASVGLAFSAVTIAVSEAFLLPAAENQSPVRGDVLAPGSYTNIYRQTTMAIGLEPQHGALNGSSVRFCLARTDFKSWGATNDLTATQKPNFSPFSAQERLRNG
jgi:hypothetical protein